MRQIEITGEIAPAYDVRISDSKLREYMQTKVLAGEIEADAFWASVEAYRENFAQRRYLKAQPEGRILEFEDSELQLPPEVEKRAEEFFKKIGYSKYEKAVAYDNYRWKTSLLPKDVKNILSVGCGGGAELVFLRSIYPNAKITALDYRQYLIGGRLVLDILDVNLVVGDIFENIRNLKGGFDLIFSNHVIEHFYEPDEQIAFLAGLLSEGGVFSAGLPLDAYPFADKLIDLAGNPRAIHATDMNWLDVRHPWKTNESDLAATLRDAGLNEVAICKRAACAKSAAPRSRISREDRERFGRVLFSFTVAPLVGLIRTLFRDAPPRRLVRLLFALDRRLWFGRYKVKLDVQIEVFAMATRV